MHVQKNSHDKLRPHTDLETLPYESVTRMAVRKELVFEVFRVGLGDIQYYYSRDVKCLDCPTTHSSSVCKCACNFRIKF